MPLRDHFQPPLSLHRAWEPYHSRWANSIADQLNARLPPRFFAEPQMPLGSHVEGDVVEFDSLDEDLDESEVAPGEGEGGGVAVAVWAPAVATLIMPAVFPDNILSWKRFRPVPLDLEAAYEDACRRGRL
jgi:hypothetical protein